MIVITKLLYFMQCIKTPSYMKNWSVFAGLRHNLEIVWSLM
jgi:hypothetical protein